jgi:hypothetical protein
MLDYIVRFFLRKTLDCDSVLDAWYNENFDGNYSYTSNWLLSDDEATYNQFGNKKYSKIDISYHINENGFRISNRNYIELENIIACFGCSNTFGIGIKWEETWPYLLNQKLGDNFLVKNYGVSGASNDMIARLICNYLSKHKPKAICCFFPEIFRIELIESERNYMINFADHFYKMLVVDKKYKELNITREFIRFFKAYQSVFTENNCIYNFIKNYKLIESTCKANNVDLYWCSSTILELNMKDEKLKNVFRMDNHVAIDESMLSIKELARDNHHNGLKFNEKLSTKFLEKLTWL